MHLFNFHMSVELLQLRCLYALKLCKVVVPKAFKLGVQVVWVIFPVVL